MYYRQFRCKGKGKGKCSTSYTHEDFLELATRQLGQHCIDRVKSEINFPSLSSVATKRNHDGVSTGFTPNTKRVASHSHRHEILSPTKSPDSRGISMESLSLAQMRLRAEKAESMNEILQESLKQKDEYISILKERISLFEDQRSHMFEMKEFKYTLSFQLFILRNSSGSPVSVDDSPMASGFIDNPPSPHATPDDYYQIPNLTLSSQSSIRVSPSIRDPSNGHSPKQTTYAEVVGSFTSSPPQILRRIPVKSSPDSRERLQRKHDLTVLYLLGLQQKKIGQLRKEAKNLGLSLHAVQNISFIGTSVAELLIETSLSKAFIHQAKSLGFNVNLDLSITDKSPDNPVWIHYGHPDFSMSEVIKSNFIRRVSHEIKSTSSDRVRQYYSDWAKELNWKLPASTASSS